MNITIKTSIYITSQGENTINLNSFASLLYTLNLTLDKFLLTSCANRNNTFRDALKHNTTVLVKKK